MFSISFFAKMIFNTKTSPHFPKTHHSNVPPFHYSNWGEAPKFTKPRNDFITNRTFQKAPRSPAAASQKRLDSPVHYLIIGKLFF